MFTERERAAAVAACRAAGENPFEVVPCGPATRLRGDALTDGPEVERWMLELPEAARRRLGIA